MQSISPAQSKISMTPTAYRAGGAGVLIQFAIVLSPLGLVLVAGTTRGICRVRFGECREVLEAELRDEFPQAGIQSGDPVFAEWVKAVVAAIRQPAANHDVPLDIRGTAFQHRVWEALRKIPPGSTATYQEIAESIARPSACRAVAGACARNPVAVLIPCHRVVRTDGGLGGYRWGVDRKKKLLRMEETSHPAGK